MELRIRVYPDKIHIDSHETMLTVAEREWGKHFWEQCWRAGGGVDAQARAWRQLAERFGAERAAWIARQLRPTNPADKPQGACRGRQAAGPAPRSPTRRPRRRAMMRFGGAHPRRGCCPAPVDRGGVPQQPGRAGRKRPRDRAAAGRRTRPGTVAKVPPPSDDTLVDRRGMRWMVDFADAESARDGAAMALTPTQVAVGIQALFVFGVRGSLPAADGAPLQFAALLDAHHYTDGLEFLRFGAPTNNTAELRSAYSSVDAGETRSSAASWSRRRGGCGAAGIERA